ncbi:MAG: hypothetical protein E3J54_04365 [Actinobacteria bacterium]|nr:MAG: hypothetical protein E3J54_04365 [Actinomycetota bacterium]
MPTYEYKCKSCKDSFEEFQKVNDKALSKCPQCGGELARVFHPVGVIYKGSGFYTTDYKNKHKKPKEKVKEAAKKTDTKSDKKEKNSTCSTKECPAAGSCN